MSRSQRWRIRKTSSCTPANPRLELTASLEPKSTAVVAVAAAQALSR
jgi:hypothetical protein